MPHATDAAAALRPGKADDALMFRLAVELGDPLASELCGPATRQHHDPSLVQLARSCARR
jgi:hypothetical protein